MSFYSAILSVLKISKLLSYQTENTPFYCGAPSLGLPTAVISGP